jgi:D-sedoheptulose 7-phosphate isomerase
MPVAGQRAQIVAETFAATIRLHERVMAMDPAPILTAADLIVEALRRDGKVLAFGNGGSAADAQHLAAELVTRFARERRGFAAMALATDAAVVTSIGNDLGFERVFARQIEALGRLGDVAFAISTSGASPNVVAGLAEARARGLTTIALTGRDGGPLGAAAEIHLNVPDESTARVQEVHRTLLHVICELVERTLTNKE